MLNIIKNLSIGVVIGAALVGLGSYAMSIPDVQFSYSTDQCVKVLNYVEGDNYNCENLPPKFNHVWVK